MRRFQGEDLNVGEKRRQQREQYQTWLIQQIAERRVLRQKCVELEKAHQEALISRDQRAVTLELMEQECRRKLNDATAKFNVALV